MQIEKTMTAIGHPICPRDMRVGDTVIRKDQAGNVHEWGFTIVKQVHEEKVHLYRPYAGYHNTLYSRNSVICYIGIEEYVVSQNDDHAAWVLCARAHNLE